MLRPYKCTYPLIFSYGSQARAAWQFNGSGAIDPDDGFKWTGAGAGVTAPAGWAALDDGTQPKTSGDRFNDVVNTAGWALI